MNYNKEPFRFTSSKEPTQRNYHFISIYIYTIYIVYVKILWTTYQFKREQIYNSHINSYINSYSDATHVSNSYSKALHFSTALWGYLCNKTSHTITMTLSFWVLLSPWCFIPWLPISKFEAILLATSVSHQNTQWRVVQVSLVFPCFPKMFWSFDTSSSPRKPGPQHSQVRAPWPLWRYWSSQTQVAPGWKETHAMLRWNQALQTNLSKTSCRLGTLILDTSWYTVSVLLLILVRLRNGSALRRSFFGPKKWSLFHLQVKDTLSVLSLKAPMQSPLKTGSAPNAQKAGWKFEVYLLYLITPKQQSTQQSPSGTWSLWFNLQTCDFFLTGQRRKHSKKITLRSLQQFSREV